MQTSLHHFWEANQIQVMSFLSSGNIPRIYKVSRCGFQISVFAAKKWTGKINFEKIVWQVSTLIFTELQYTLVIDSIGPREQYLKKSELLSSSWLIPRLHFTREIVPNDEYLRMQISLDNTTSKCWHLYLIFYFCLDRSTGWAPLMGKSNFGLSPIGVNNECSENSQFFWSNTFRGHIQSIKSADETSPKVTLETCPLRCLKSINWCWICVLKKFILQVNWIHSGLLATRWIQFSTATDAFLNFWHNQQGF